MCATFRNNNPDRRSIRRRCSFGLSLPGFTLPEIIIGSVLMLLLLGLMFSFLVPAMRASVRVSQRTEIQQEAVCALNRLTGDLRLSSAGGISYFATGTTPGGGPVYLGIMRIADVDAQGHQIWEQALYVYCWEKQGAPLIRKIWTPAISFPAMPILMTNTPTRVSETILIAIATHPGITRQELAHNVSEFKITGAVSGGTVSSPLELFISLARTGATGSTTPESFKLSYTLSLKNNQ